MSGSGVNIPVGINWAIPIRVEKSSWASRIIIMIVALVIIMPTTVADLALRLATGGLMLGLGETMNASVWMEVREDKEEILDMVQGLL